MYTDHKFPAPPGAGPLAPAVGAAAGSKALLGRPQLQAGSSRPPAAGAPEQRKGSRVRAAAWEEEVEAGKPGGGPVRMERERSD